MIAFSSFLWLLGFAQIKMGTVGGVDLFREWGDGLVQRNLEASGKYKSKL